MTPRLRALALFAGVFFVVNLAFDGYRAGGLTPGAIASAVVVTLVATGIYWIYLRWQARKKGDDE
ncbi:MAG: hypothetical protein WBA67_12130 [Jannaschia sp.]